MAEEKDKTPNNTSSEELSREGRQKDAPASSDTDNTEVNVPKEENKETEKTEEVIEAVEPEKIPALKPGMTVRVYQKIKELNAKGEEKERIQYFEGMIIAKKHGKEKGATITVRKVSNGVGVEKIFPLNLPTIDKIEIKKQAKVKRAKLYFLKRGYKKKLKEIKKTK
jgi:large subunit ribosomal protein L19